MATEHKPNLNIWKESRELKNVSMSFHVSMDNYLILPIGEYISYFGGRAGPYTNVCWMELSSVLHRLLVIKTNIDRNIYPCVSNRHLKDW